jgi:hypothetical protein
VGLDGPFSYKGSTVELGHSGRRLEMVKQKCLLCSKEIEVDVYDKHNLCDECISELPQVDPNEYSGPTAEDLAELGIKEERLKERREAERDTWPHAALP